MTQHENGSADDAAMREPLNAAAYDDEGVGMRHRPRRRMDERLLEEHAEVVAIKGRVLRMPTINQAGVLIAMALGVNQLGNCASSKLMYASDADRQYARIDSFMVHQRAVNDTVSQRQNASLRDREDMRVIMTNNSLVLCAMAQKLNVDQSARCAENERLNTNLRERGSRAPFEPVP